MVLLLSEASNKSPHVLREVEYAVSHHTPVLVYSLEEVNLSKSMEYFLMTHQWITDNKNKDEQLLQSIQRLKAKTTGEYVTEHIHSANNREKGSKRPTVQAFLLQNQLRFVLPVCILVLLVIILVVLLKKPIPAISSDPAEFGKEQSSTAVDITYSVGDTITFGTYYGEPIEWRILKVQEDNTLLLLSKYILTMKSYDTPEGGVYNEYDGVDYWSYENHTVEDEELLVKI